MVENVIAQDITGEEKVEMITSRLSNYSFRMGEVVDANKKAQKKKQMIKKGKIDGRPSVLQKLENYKKAKGVI